MTTITKTNTQVTSLVANSLIRVGKHRAGAPFIQELKRFLDNPQGEYYFLSEDYYAHTLKVEGGVFVLTVDSTNPKVVARVEDINDGFAAL